LWIATNELPATGGHPFYQRLNQVLDAHGFDAFVEAQCAAFYATTIGRPSLTPGTYFRLLLIGYFEGIDAERGIAWRTADSLALRGFLGLGLEEAPPDHSTISRTRRLTEDLTAVFALVLPSGAADAFRSTNWIAPVGHTCPQSTHENSQ
jgi:transposase